MSWFGGYKPKPPVDPREAKRTSLEAERQERLQRAKQRAARQKQLEEAQKAQAEADQALEELLNIAEDIFGDLEDDSSEDIDEDELLAPDIMEDFDVENGTDGDKAAEKLGTLQCPFTKSDIDFWFTQLETQLEVLGVKSQWVKRLALQRVLPPEYQEDVKGLLRVSKSASGTDIYKRLKTELLKLYGQKPEDAYNRAKNRIMSGTPSQLGKALIDDLCVCDVKLTGKCCNLIIWAMFKEKLPIVIRNHIARMTFNQTTYQEIFDAADHVFESNKGAEPRGIPTSVAATTTTATSPEVAAVSSKNKNNTNRQSGKKNKNQGQQNKNQGGQSSGQSQSGQNKGQKHATASGADDKLCKIHYKFGVNANFCVAPWKCPMKETLATPSN